MDRRASQLGLRGRTLARYTTEWTLHIEDITGFVREQEALVRSTEEHRDLLVPRAEIYWPASDETVAPLGLTSIGSSVIQEGPLGYDE